MRKCNKCGHENIDEAKFCEKCGNELTSQLFCPSCGKPNDKNAQFCERCGESLGSTPQAHQPAVAKQSKRKRRFRPAWFLLLLLLIPLFCIFSPIEGSDNGFFSEIIDQFKEIINGDENDPGNGNGNNGNNGECADFHPRVYDKSVGNYYEYLTDIQLIEGTITTFGCDHYLEGNWQGYKTGEERCQLMVEFLEEFRGEKITLEYAWENSGITGSETSASMQLNGHIFDLGRHLFDQNDTVHMKLIHDGCEYELPSAGNCYWAAQDFANATATLEECKNNECTWRVEGLAEYDDLQFDSTSDIFVPNGSSLTCEKDGDDKICKGSPYYGSGNNLSLYSNKCRFAVPYQNPQNIDVSTDDECADFKPAFYENGPSSLIANTNAAFDCMQAGWGESCEFIIGMPEKYRNTEITLEYEWQNSGIKGSYSTKGYHAHNHLFGINDYPSDQQDSLKMKLVYGDCEYEVPPVQNCYDVWQDFGSAAVTSLQCRPEECTFNIEGLENYRDLYPTNTNQTMFGRGSGSCTLENGIHRCTDRYLADRDPENRTRISFMDAESNCAVVKGIEEDKPESSEPLCCDEFSRMFYNQWYKNGTFGMDITCQSFEFGDFPIQHAYGEVYDSTGKFVSSIMCKREENFAPDMLQCQSLDAYSYTDPNVIIELEYTGGNGDTCQGTFRYEVPDFSNDGGDCAPMATSNGYPWCRSGPGTAYSTVTNLEKGQQVTILNRSGSGNWWEVQYSDSGASCWVSNFLLDIEGDTSCVPVVKGTEKEVEDAPSAEPEEEESDEEDPGEEEPECLSPSDPDCLYPECPCCRPCVQF